MRVIWITAAVVLIDQLTKVIVLNTMYLGQSIALIGDWLLLTFTENPGMAFGITFGPRALVTILSITATALIIGYMHTVRRAGWPYRASLALILGGALGNIIDRVFYGVLQGYDTFFVGRVVDFIHVNFWRGYVPEVVPLIGGTYVALFPIWNFADMAIVAGVVGILVFQHMAVEGAQRDDTDPAEHTGGHGDDPALENGAEGIKPLHPVDSHPEHDSRI
ncbi:MAG: signal peptidase II [Rhodothermales bacterium]